MNSIEKRDRKTTIKDIAKATGLSIATVSRVLNNSRNVKKEYREKVNKVARELNYEPNMAAKYIKGAKTNNIAVLVPDISHPFFSTILKGMLEQSRKTGKNLIIYSSDGKRENEEISLYQISKALIDGFLFSPISRTKFIQPEKNGINLPTAIFGRRKMNIKIPHIYSDNIKGGYLATKYLLRLGRKEVGFLAGFWEAPCSSNDIDKIINEDWIGSFSTLDRFKGYLKALKEYNIEYDPGRVVICGYRRDDGYKAMQELFTRMVKIDSVLSPNDIVATGIISFLEEQNLDIPGDISVIGYDDNLIAPVTKPGLTSIKQNPEMIGKLSIEVINKMIAGEEIEKKDIVIDISLSIRGSTGKIKKPLE